MFKEIPAAEEITQSDEEGKSEIVLRSDIHQIITCFGNEEQFGNQLHDIENFLINSGAKEVDFYDDAESHDENKFAHDGSFTYVISEIDTEDKGTDDLLDCTSVVAVGVDKMTGENISFLSHQDPKEILKKHRQKFLNDLRGRLQELKDRSEDHTIDIRIIGGNFLPPGKYRYHSQSVTIKSESNVNNYLDSIQLLSETIRDSLGFNPEIIEPKFHAVPDTVYFDNKNRRVYLLRPGDEMITNQTVSPDWVKHLGENWKDERSGVTK